MPAKKKAPAKKAVAKKRTAPRRTVAQVGVRGVRLMREKLAFAALQALRKLQAKSYELEEWLYDRAFSSSPSNKAALKQRLQTEIPRTRVDPLRIETDTTHVLRNDA